MAGALPSETPGDPRAMQNPGSPAMGTDDSTWVWAHSPHPQQGSSCHKDLELGRAVGHEWGMSRGL